MLDVVHVRHSAFRTPGMPLGFEFIPLGALVQGRGGLLGEARWMVMSVERHAGVCWLTMHRIVP